MVAPVPGLPDARRRADDRRRQRPPASRAICDVLGLPELVDDPRFRDEPRPRARTATSSSRSLVEQRLAPRRRRRSGTSVSRAAGVPAAPVADVRRRRDAAADGGARDAPARSPTPRIPDLRLPALPLSSRRRARAPPAARRRTSAQHTAEILREAGYDGRRDRGARRTRSDHAHDATSPPPSARRCACTSPTPRVVRRLAQAIGDAGGILGAIDLVRVEPGKKVRDVTVDARERRPPRAIVAAVHARRRRRGRARLRPDVPPPPRRQDRDASRSRR